MEDKRKLGWVLVAMVLFLLSCSPEGRVVEDITKKSMMGQSAEGFTKATEHVELCSEFFLFAEDACATENGITVYIENNGKRSVRGIKIGFFDEQGRQEDVIFPDTYIKRGREEYAFEAPFRATKIMLIPVVMNEEETATDIPPTECRNKATVLDELSLCRGSP